MRFNSKHLKGSLLFTVGILLVACSSKPVYQENTITGLLNEYVVDCGTKFDDYMDTIESTSGDLQYTYYLDENLTKKYYDMEFDGFCASYDGGTSKDYWVKVTAGFGTLYKEVSKVAKISAHCVESSLANIPLDVIGYKTVSCKSCHNQLGDGSLMETNDIVLSDTSRDIIYNYGLKTGVYVTEKTTDEPFEVGDFKYGLFANPNVPNYFYLPKINFEAFSDKNILIRYRTNNRPGWGEQYAVHFGLDEEGTNLFDGLFEDGWNVNPNGVLMLNYNSGTKTISVKNLGNLVKEAFINDEKIIKGENPIVIYAKGEHRSIALYEGCITLDHIHDWGVGEAGGKEKIGHKVRKCNTCNYSEVSDSVMLDDDIDISTLNAYGANATGHINATDEANRGLTGGIKWAHDIPNDYSINFPKVDYSLYTNVIFEFGTSTNTWNGSYVRLSINDKNDLLDLENSIGIYGAIEMRYNANESKLDVVSRTNTGMIKTISITDPNIINGTESLHGTLTLGISRSFYLNKIIVNHSEHQKETKSYPSTEVIGYKEEMCSICLSHFGSTDIMENADINLYDGYGVGVDGLPGYHAFDGEKITLGNGDSSIGTIYLPKVNFKLYSEVKFNMYHSNLWGQLGFDAEHTFGYFDDSDTDRSIVLTIRKTETTYDVSLDYEARSIHLETTINDEKIINGYSSFSLYFSLGAYSALFLRSVSVTK